MKYWIVAFSFLFPITTPDVLCVCVCVCVCECLFIFYCNVYYIGTSYAPPEEWRKFELGFKLDFDLGNLNLIETYFKLS